MEKTTEAPLATKLDERQQKIVEELKAALKEAQAGMVDDLIVVYRNKNFACGHKFYCTADFISVGATMLQRHAGDIYQKQIDAMKVEQAKVANDN